MQSIHNKHHIKILNARGLILVIGISQPRNMIEMTDQRGTETAEIEIRRTDSHISMKKDSNQSHLLHKVQQTEVDHRAPTLSQDSSLAVGIGIHQVVISPETPAEIQAVVLLTQIQVVVDLVVTILNTEL